ncbi:MAG: hypothetical protein ACLP5H_11545 [Desulfomonilaceae bacterium]
MKGLIVFCLVTFGWLFFKITEFHQVISYVTALRTTGGIYDIGKIRWILLHCIPIALYHALYLFNQHFGGFNIIVADCLYAATLFAIVCCSESPPTFIYFQF